MIAPMYCDERRPMFVHVLAGVGRLVDAVARREGPARLIARSDVDGVRLGRRNRDRADRRDVDVVEDRLPCRAGVRRLPDAAFRRADVVGRRIARYAGGRRDVARARRSDRAPTHLAEECGAHGRRLRRRGGHERERNPKAGEEKASRSKGAERVPDKIIQCGAHKISGGAVIQGTCCRIARLRKGKVARPPTFAVKAGWAVVQGLRRRSWHSYFD